MNNFLSRYSPSFVRALVYMLQQSEYNTHDYLAWFKRTRNFKMVARRKHLVMTVAATGFLIFVWLEAAILLIIILAMVGLSLGHSLWLLAALAGILIAPYLLAYSLV